MKLDIGLFGLWSNLILNKLQSLMDLSFNLRKNILRKKKLAIKQNVNGNAFHFFSERS